MNNIILVYKERAKKTNKPFDLTFAEFEALVRSPCFYCGNPHGNCRIIYKTEEFKYNGLDRKDPSLGYTSGNCVPCCNFCNYTKSDTPFDKFTSWIHKASAHLKNGMVSTAKPNHKETP